MDSIIWLVVVMVVIWVGGGLWVSLRMSRRGHSLKLALPLGLILGPFLAFYDPAPTPSAAAPATNSSPERSDGLAVLIGVDGSAESVTAAKSAVGILGSRLTSLTLARVLDYEDQGPRTGIPTQSAAYAGLVDLGAQLGVEPTGLELLYGAPAEALAERAAALDVDMIVVGARGRGLTNRLLGSVATELVGTSAVPVLVGSSHLTEDQARPGSETARSRTEPTRGQATE